PPSPNSSVHDSSTVGTQVGSLTITGNVTYSFFTNGTCTLPASSTQTVAISGGIVPNASATSPLAAGSYAFEAFYAGDGNYNSSTSSCENFVVSKATPTPSTAQDLIPNDSFTLTGGAAGDGSGTITFYLFAPGQTCSVANASNAAFTQTVNEHGAGIDPSGTYNTTNSGVTAVHAQTVGTWTWLVVYNGDNNNNSATSNCVETFTISNG